VRTRGDVKVSSPLVLLEAHESAGAAVPPLSTLLERAIAEALRDASLPVPEVPPPSPETAAATAARQRRRASRQGR